MKKWVVILLIVAVLVVGCSQTEETDDTTQDTQQPVQTEKVDLAAITLETSSPSFEAGDRLTIYPTVKNLGSKVSNVEVGLYANGELINTFTFDFKEGETKSIPYAWYPEESGEYKLKIVVDPDTKLNEDKTSNNEAATDAIIFD